MELSLPNMDDRKYFRKFLCDQWKIEICYGTLFEIKINGCMHSDGKKFGYVKEKK
jgi:hypothetical protein